MLYEPKMIQRIITLLLATYLFVYVWAVPMLMFDLVPVWGSWMGGYLLILQGSLLALWLTTYAGSRGALAAVLIATLSFGVEYLGVTTGMPFGHYDYTDILGFKLGGAVPLPIAFAWLMVIPGTIGMARLLGARGRAVVLVAPLLALALDLTLEPVTAYVTGYWQWFDRGPYYGIPTANFVAWGITALCLTALTSELIGRHEQAPASFVLPATLYMLNLLQFTLVDLAYGYIWAAVIGGGALLVCVRPLYATLVKCWQARRQTAAPLTRRRRTPRSNLYKQ